jgi:hypothetical protein
MTPERWREVEVLYVEARARAPGERAALLPSTDPDLRRAVEARLAREGPPPDDTALSSVGHVVHPSPEMNKEVLDWFDKHLGPVGSTPR